jgi:hypothetical protein
MPPAPRGYVWRLPTVTAKVNAPWALCLQVTALAGSVLEHRSSTERVVEFDTRVRGRTIATTRLMRLAPPRITYHWLSGPLPYVRETIDAVSLGPDRTELRYGGAFSPGPLLRDQVVVPMVRWRFRVQKRRDLSEAKRLAEDQYGASHVFRPQV